MTTVELHPRPETRLTDCEHEQIHIPGTVQSFGCLIAFDRNQTVTRASANIETRFGVAAQDLVGKSIDLVLQRASVEKLAARYGQKQPSSLIRLHDFHGKELFALVHYLGSEGYLDILEHGDELDPLTAIKSFVSAISKTTAEAEYTQTIAEQVRQIAKFDRVKIYKFDTDWHGEVIAESLAEGIPSYKGLHFPESDIPKQARELYLRNRVRVIGDVNDAQSPILQTSNLKPLDLSFSLIRSVSPIHLQYLRNMKVASSTSISIAEHGQLWGLIACHHMSPRKFTIAEESFFQTISMICSSRLADLKRGQLAQQKQRAFRFLQKILSELDQHKTNIEKIKSQLDDLIPATGVAIWADGEVHKKNSVPEEDTLHELVEWLERGENNVFSCDDLPERYGESIRSYACGLLAAKVSRPSPMWLLWFRLEATLEVAWAGDPYQPKTSTEFGDRLYPRKSFNLWKEEKRGHSPPWTTAEIDAATELAKLLAPPL